MNVITKELFTQQYDVVGVYIHIDRNSSTV